jgi:hypothetical protein
MAQEKGVCHNPHNTSNWDSHFCSLDYTWSFCQNVVSTNKFLVLTFSLYFRICLHVGLPRIGPVFPVSCKTVYWWVTANCCVMSDILQPLFYDPSTANEWTHMYSSATYRGGLKSLVFTLTEVSVGYSQTTGCLWPVTNVFQLKLHWAKVQLCLAHAS